MRVASIIFFRSFSLCLQSTVFIAVALPLKTIMFFFRFSIALLRHSGFKPYVPCVNRCCISFFYGFLRLLNGSVLNLSFYGTWQSAVPGTFLFSSSWEIHSGCRPGWGWGGENSVFAHPFCIMHASKAQVVALYVRCMFLQQKPRNICTPLIQVRAYTTILGACCTVCIQNDRRLSSCKG